VRIILSVGSFLLIVLAQCRIIRVTSDLRETFWLASGVLWIIHIAVFGMLFWFRGKSRRTFVLTGIISGLICTFYVHTPVQSNIFCSFHRIFANGSCSKCIATFNLLFVIYDEVPELEFRQWCDSQALVIEPLPPNKIESLSEGFKLKYSNLVSFDRDILHFPSDVVFYRNRTARMRVYWNSGRVYLAYSTF
jgi:hypothetical protein